MKKLLICLLVGAFLFACGTAQAASTETIEIIDQVLNNVTTSITGARYVSNFERVAFYVDYDETDSGSVVSVAITAHISYDNTNWIAARWFDFAGGTTLQTTETLTADGSYVGWFDPDLQIPYMRITVTGAGTSATELANVQANITGIY